MRRSAEDEPVPIFRSSRIPLPDGRGSEVIAEPRALEPGGDQPLTLGDGAADPLSELVLRRPDRRVAGDLLQRGLRDGDDGRPAGHRLERRQTETFVKRREGKNRSGRVEDFQSFKRNEA